MFHTKSAIPSYTVAIVTKNRIKSLRLCLYSLVQQKYLPNEVILIDNDPSHNANAVIKHFKKHLPFKYITSLKNVPANRNIALRAASSNYLVFIDDDCLLHPEWSQALYLSLAQNPSFVIGRSLYREAVSIIEKAQLIRYNYWFYCKINRNYGYPTAYNFDTKNLALNLDFIKKHHIAFDESIYVNSTIDGHTDTDLGLQFQKYGAQGVFAPDMRLVHLETKSFKRMLCKGYATGKAGHILAKKWLLFQELIYPPEFNPLIFFKRIIRYWLMYSEYDRFKTQPFLAKISVLILIKLYDASYLYGYWKQSRSNVANSKL